MYMDTKNLTIKDIAMQLGVSSTTVHKVIYNKPGVGEKTKQRVNSYIQAHNFQLNRAASALKRGTIQLAYVGINASESDILFYHEIEEGLVNACEDYKTFNVELRIYNSEGTVAAQSALLEKLYAEQSETLDGLILISAHEFLISPTVRKFTKRGIKVVTLVSDARDSGRSAYVCGDSTMAGHVAGEILTKLSIPQNGQILLLCGFRAYSNHQLASASFVDFIKHERPDIDVIELYQDASDQITEDKITKYLHAVPDIAAISCGTARGTPAMCRVIGAQPQQYKLVGSDVFAELRPYFENRLLCATVFQNPRDQARRALASLYHLITLEKPVQEYQYERIDVVLRSNFEGYLSESL